MTAQHDLPEQAGAHVAAGGARRGVLGMVAGLAFGLVVRLALRAKRPGRP